MRRREEFSKCGSRNERPDSSRDIIKRLKDCGFQFSGQGRNEDPEEFLERLSDCQKALDIDWISVFLSLGINQSRREKILHQARIRVINKRAEELSEALEEI
ncbi:hypothetical protein TSAR_016696 [Trichomalopsis sarcophagae]|uniref:Uncharacterized protein n=1 Tax=Trichomalopsis sarcophagae TaxID=543379 RepID=A0A232EFD5_9HYME|nr:hypothetical protein TSAR_016696 [Trichomalopsis sarcophagae]